jgi:hypothetical protein
MVLPPGVACSTHIVSQNHLSCLSAIWYIQCWCPVKPNRKKNLNGTVLFSIWNCPFLSLKNIDVNLYIKKKLSIKQYKQWPDYIYT